MSLAKVFLRTSLGRKLSVALRNCSKEVRGRSVFTRDFLAKVGTHATKYTSLEGCCQSLGTDLLANGFGITLTWEDARSRFSNFL